MTETGMRRSLTETATEQILDIIREANLVAGDSIPATGELALRLGVSRTVIRESLAELTGRGLLRRQQGREGTFAVPGADQISMVFRSQLDFQDISALEVQEFREGAEVGAARAAARRATLQQVAAISDLIASLRTAASERELVEIDVEIHRTIAHAAGPLFGVVHDGIAPLLLSQRRAVWRSYLEHGGDLEYAVRRHFDIRDRIAARDVDGAGEAMLLDLADTRAEIDKLPQGAPAD
jgi:GntR family transcriptional repressor for pyruvate dehydrogenase complex